VLFPSEARAGSRLIAFQLVAADRLLDVFKQLEVVLR
jgi:hypothetical protein